AFGFGVVAEVIALLLEAVDHLEHIREVTDQQAARSISADKPAPAAPAPSAAPAYEPTVRVRAKTTTTIFVRPDHDASVSGQLNEGQAMPIYGRTGDNAWFSISRQGTLWL